MLPLDITDLQSQVISLVLAKKLKEAGVPQDSAFYWVDIKGYSDRKPHVQNRPKEWLSGKGTLDSYWGTDDHVSAFTATDIGELLSMFTTLYFGVERHSNDWRAGFLKSGEGFIGADTQVEALGELLLYALKKGLIRF